MGRPAAPPRVVLGILAAIPAGRPRTRLPRLVRGGLDVPAGDDPEHPLPPLLLVLRELLYRGLYARQRQATWAFGGDARRARRPIRSSTRTRSRTSGLGPRRRSGSAWCPCSVGHLGDLARAPPGLPGPAGRRALELRLDPGRLRASGRPPTSSTCRSRSSISSPRSRSSRRRSTPPGTCPRSSRSSCSIAPASNVA